MSSVVARSIFRTISELLARASSNLTSAIPSFFFDRVTTVRTDLSQHLCQRGPPLRDPRVPDHLFPGHRPAMAYPGQHGERPRLSSRGRVARQPRPEAFHLAEDTRYHAFSHIFKHKGEGLESQCGVEVLQVSPGGEGLRSARSRGQGRPLICRSGRRPQTEIDEPAPRVAPFGQRLQRFRIRRARAGMDGPCVQRPDL